MAGVRSSLDVVGGCGGEALLGDVREHVCLGPAVAFLVVVGLGYLALPRIDEVGEGGMWIALGDIEGFGMPDGLGALSAVLGSMLQNMPESVRRSRYGKPAAGAESARAPLLRTVDGPDQIDGASAEPSSVAEQKVQERRAAFKVIDGGS